MIINSIDLINFRQYRGTQKVTFAPDDDSPRRNVTVILGENGRGKTGLFRALAFCLFNDHKLPQDEDAPPDQLHLPNLVSLEDAAQSGVPLISGAEVHFSHAGIRYQMRRTISAVRDSSGRVTTQPHELRLTCTYATGNTSVFTDPGEIRTIVARMVDERVKDYFFFDGERIQRLTLATSTQKREVAQGIRRLTRIEALEEAIQVMSRLKASIDKDLQRRATGEYGKLLADLSTLEEQIATTRTSLANLEAEEVAALRQKEKLDEMLDKQQDVKQLLGERKGLEEELSRLRTTRGNRLREMGARVARASMLLVAGTVDRVRLQIQTGVDAGLIPAPVRREFIENLLVAQQCICCRPLLPGDQATDAVLMWRDRVADSETEGSVFRFWNILGPVTSHRDEVASSLEHELHEYATMLERAESVEAQLQDLTRRIGDSGRKDTLDLENERARVLTSIGSLGESMRARRSELGESVLRLQSLTERRKSLEQEQRLSSELAARSRIVQDAHEALVKTSDYYVTEVTRKLENAAGQYLEVLLDEDSRTMLRSIVIGDDYSLQVLDKWGRPFLADVSAGQRQILSLAFIAGLASIAAGNTSADMPLFMDTPFGRLSSEHRRNILRHIPGICSQCILLATDTEFARQEAAMLRESGSWGNMYRLVQRGPGDTAIQSVPLNEAESHLIR